MGYTENEIARLPGDLQRKDPDVVKVVRCKDCAFCEYEKDNGKFHCRTRNGMGIRAVKPCDFCSYGERKKTDEKQ